MSNHHDRELLAEAFDGLHYRLLGGTIQGTGCLVKHQHLGLFVEVSRNTDPLPLAATTPDSPLAHKAIVELRCSR